jgi:hypothetical protein
MVRASRWSALTPSLPFSGLGRTAPPLASPLFGAIHPEAYQLVPVLRALEMPGWPAARRRRRPRQDHPGRHGPPRAHAPPPHPPRPRPVPRGAAHPVARRDAGQVRAALRGGRPPQTLKLQRELGVDANPWRTHERIIASYHYLKQPDVLEQFRSAAEPGEDGRCAGTCSSSTRPTTSPPPASGATRTSPKMLQRIAPWFEHRVFLTATPHNGHTRSFSGLLEALDPVRFTRKSELDDEDRRRVGETGHPPPQERDQRELHRRGRARPLLRAHRDRRCPPCTSAPTSAPSSSPCATSERPCSSACAPRHIRTAPPPPSPPRCCRSACSPARGPSARAGSPCSRASPRTAATAEVVARVRSRRRHRRRRRAREPPAPRRAHRRRLAAPVEDSCRDELDASHPPRDGARASPACRPGSSPTWPQPPRSPNRACGEGRRTPALPLSAP